MIERFCVHTGDNRTVMATMPDCSVDSIVTDPPYELGFMGKKWDASGIAYDLEVWRQALRVLKPGGHLISFGGSRTYHRMACAVEDAGFEVRDQILWLYGSGFPKSLNISKAIDAALGAEREVIGQYQGASNIGKKADGKWGYGHDGQSNKGANRTVFATAPATAPATAFDGWGTALKPSHEPAVLARKPLIGTVAANVLAHSTGGLNIGACRIQFASEGDKAAAAAQRACQQEGSQPFSGGYSDGPGSLVPYLANLDQGRWPANLIHDGSDEVLAVFPNTKSGDWNGQHTGGGTNGHLSGKQDRAFFYKGDSGSAARYFYTAKASRADRDDGCESLDLVAPHEITGRKPGSAGQNNPRAGVRTGDRRNTHPTVKPTELMRYLCRLVTPPGGTVLDPFCGSGSTGRAALLDNFNFIGIELLEDHAAIARARIAVIADRGVQLEIA